MSIYPAAYIHEVLTLLHTEHHADVRHVCLTASEETVRARLQQRGDSPRAYSWQHLDRIAAAFRTLAAESYAGAQVIPTDGMTPDQVVAEVLPYLSPRG
jgi:hypothetical protein